jgi:hypothetical protein
MTNPFTISFVAATCAQGLEALVFTPIFVLRDGYATYVHDQHEKDPTARPKKLPGFAWDYTRQNGFRSLFKG